MDRGRASKPVLEGDWAVIMSDARWWQAGPNLLEDMQVEIGEKVPRKLQRVGKEARSPSRPWKVFLPVTGDTIGKRPGDT